MCEENVTSESGRIQKRINLKFDAWFKNCFFKLKDSGHFWTTGITTAVH